MPLNIELRHRVLQGEAANQLPEKPRVLLIAEAANPEWSSIPLEGWSHARALAQIVDGHLVTQVRNRRAILDAGLVEGRDFTAIDSETAARPIYRLSNALRGGKGKGWTTITALSTFAYYYFEQLVWKQFGPQIAAREFQIVHRLTPLSPTTPSLLASRCRRVGVPFILGPLNGGLPWPRHLSGIRVAEHEWLSYVRWAHRFLPAYRSTRRDATAILIGSMATWEQMPEQYRDKCVYIPENAIDPERFPQTRTRCASRPIRLIFIGRLVPYKGADMALEAAAPLLRDGIMTLDILGEGPHRFVLERIVEQEGVGTSVVFHGEVKHQAVCQFLLNSDLLVFPSIREFGGAVVLEAMAVGSVPMIVNYGGPAELVTEKTGFRVELGNRSEIIRRLREALTRIAADPSTIDQKSQAAICRARGQFTWQAKAEQVWEVYRWVLGQRSDKPDFSMPLRELDADSTVSLPIANGQKN